MTQLSTSVLKPLYLLFNGLASRSKLKLRSTCDSVWPGLACNCICAWRLALTLVVIKFVRKSTQIFIVWTPNPSQRKLSDAHLINQSLANEIQDMSDSKCFNLFLCDLSGLVRKLASAFEHPTQDRKQDHLAAACDFVWLELTKGSPGHARANIPVTSCLSEF